MPFVFPIWKKAVITFKMKRESGEFKPVDTVRKINEKPKTTQNTETNAFPSL